jgi:hypothetical protein
MNGEGTLAQRVTKKADTGEFVVRSYSPSLLRMQITRLNLWKDKPYVQVDVVSGYFSQYVYMPKVVHPKVVVDAVWQLEEVLNIELDGFAYADAYENGRFVGLTISTPTEVRQSGLLVDPAVAAVQIAQDTKPSEGAITAGSPANSNDRTTPLGRTVSSADHLSAAAAKAPSRFHATKEVTLNRVVRDVGKIYEEVVSHFVLNDVPVRVTIDVESSQLDKLTEDQRNAIRENLKTLGFGDDDWSMD